MRLRQDHLAEKMRDEAFRKAYDELEPDFEIAETLLKYRANMEMTQADLAKKIKINRSDLSKLESGNSNPTLKTLKKIASALGLRLRLSYEVYEAQIEKTIEKAVNVQIIYFNEFARANKDKGFRQGELAVSVKNESKEGINTNRYLARQEALA